MANNLAKYYIEKRWWQIKPRQFEVGVENVNLTIGQGEFVFVIGSSGAGKSTLLGLLSGQIKPDKGSVLVDGQDVFAMRRLNQRKYNRTIGVVSQQHMLDRRNIVKKNLEAAAHTGWKNRNIPVEERINKVLGLVGLPDAAERYPGELTAGERRRVELASAMINSPDILILDEAIANLNEDSIWDVFLLLMEINRKGTTIVMSIHNSNFVNMLRRRVITLVDGRVYSDVDKGRYGEALGKKPGA